MTTVSPRTMNASSERSIPEGEIKISRRGSCSPNYVEPDHFTLLLCQSEPLRNVNDLQRTCITITLLTKPSVW